MSVGAAALATSVPDARLLSVAALESVGRAAAAVSVGRAAALSLDADKLESQLVQLSLEVQLLQSSTSGVEPVLEVSVLLGGGGADTSELELGGGATMESDEGEL